MIKLNKFLIILGIFILISLFWARFHHSKNRLIIYLNKTYESLDVAEDVCRIDNEIYVVGWKYDINNQRSSALILKLNKNGDIIWNSTYTDINGAYGRGVSCNLNEVYFYGEASNMNTSYGFIIKFNKNGEIIWTKTFSDGFIKDLSNINTEIYFLFSSYKENENYLIKLNNDGKQLFKRNLGFTANSLVIKYDKIYIAGEKEYLGRILSFLTIYDLAGNKIWNKTINLKINNMAIDLCVGSKEIYILGSGTKGYSDFVFISKIDLNRNIIWNKVWKKDLYGNLRSISIYDDYLYLCGDIEDNVLITKLDEKGNRIWDFTYGKADREDFATRIFVDKGEIYVIGSTESFTIWPRRVSFLLCIKEKQRS